MPKFEADKLQLPPRYLAMVAQLLQQHVPDAEVWAYGSRVAGDSYDASDLDLVVRNPGDLHESIARVALLKEAFVESDLPIIVQVVDWARIPEDFRHEIEAGHVVLQRASGHGIANTPSTD